MGLLRPKPKNKPRAIALSDLVRPELVFPRLRSRNREHLLLEIAGELSARGAIDDPDKLAQALLQREELGTTALGDGVAVPHCKVSGLDQPLVAVAKSPDGIDFAAPDGKLVHLFFVVISPSKTPGDHLQCLAAISRWLRADDHAETVRDLEDRDAIYDCLNQQAAGS